MRLADVQSAVVGSRKGLQVAMHKYSLNEVQHR
jgi:hypothetical protein